MDVNHDISILDIGRKDLPLGQIIRLSLAMELDTIPPQAHDFNPVTIEPIWRRLICSLNMDPRDHTVGSKLVLARRTGSTHLDRLAGFREHYRRDGRQRGPLRGGGREGTA